MGPISLAIHSLKKNHKTTPPTCKKLLIHMQAAFKNRSFLNSRNIFLVSNHNEFKVFVFTSYRKKDY